MEYNGQKTDFDGNKLEQCGVVNTVLGKTICCDPRMVNDKDKGCRVGGWPQTVFNKFHFDYEPPYTPPIESSLPTLSKLTWTEATDEICQHRPFITVIDMVPGPLHTVVIYGYAYLNGEPKLLVYDPIGDDGPVDYAVFFDVFGFKSKNPDKHLGEIFKIQRNH
jgi:hypothetical protein